MTTYQPKFPKWVDVILRIIAIAAICSVAAVILGGIFYWVGL